MCVCAYVRSIVFLSVCFRLCVHVFVCQVCACLVQSLRGVSANIAKVNWQFGAYVVRDQLVDVELTDLLQHLTF